MEDIIKESLKQGAELKIQVARENADIIAKAASMVIDVLNSGGKVLLAGNGGSAADAQHIATEFTGRFLKERKALPAIALTTDTSAITAISNDYGFENIFSRQIEALGSEGDILIAITTSGASPNILKALKTSQKLGIQSIVLSGNNREKLERLADLIISVPSEESPRIQEVHITIGHIICHLVEEKLFS